MKIVFIILGIPLLLASCVLKQEENKDVPNATQISKQPIHTLEVPSVVAPQAPKTDF